MSKCPNCNSDTKKRKQRKGFFKLIPIIKNHFCVKCSTRFSKFPLTKNHYIILKNY